MVKKALLIGINYNNTRYQLYGCQNDSINLKNILISKYGYLNENILHLIDLPNTPSDLLPTKQNIFTAIDWLVKDCIDGDVLVFSISSHGTQQKDNNKDEIDGLDEAVCPLDFMKNGFIIDDEIKQRLVNKVPKNVKLIGIFDSCHSGSVMDLKYSLITTNKKNKNENILTLKTEPKYLDTSGKIICISGCADNSTSADTVNSSGLPVGAFTWAMLEVLKLNNYNIDTLKLLLQIRDYLSKNRYKQIPQMSFGIQTIITEKFYF